MLFNLNINIFIFPYRKWHDLIRKTPTKNICQRSTDFIGENSIQPNVEEVKK